MNTASMKSPATERPVVGVVIGRFDPLHIGHLFVFDEARRRCDTLCVVVCDRAGDRFPADRRAAWVRAAVPEAHVVVVENETRFLEYRGAGFTRASSVAWGTHLRTKLPLAPDVLFTSERYGEAVAAGLGCRHESIDPERVRVPVTATMIRNDAHAHREKIAPHAREEVLALSSTV